MRYDFLGVVTTISDLTSFTNSKGESVPKRMVLLTTEERVPQSVSVELIGELAQKFRGQVGQRITVFLNFRAHQTEDGRSFNHLSAWRIDY